MDGNSIWRRSLGSYLVVLGLGVLGSAATGEAVAACSMYTGPTGMPPSWGPAAAAAATIQAANAAKPSANSNDKGGDRFGPGIVGMWKLTFVSDGTAYPATIPPGVVLDFGTSQWHSDGTEFLISGSRPPSSGDVCMGVWEQTGNATYKLKHVALAYVSSDTPPPLGPVSPAAFVGPAIMHQTITLSRSHNSFEGRFTIDQYAPDETTLLQHIGGTLTGTRFTVD
ncbi:hypothetical protein [Variovorax sp. GT1P44]|uniref:hypothetical protein n=1 Tax=Variovorax sp. GT1P44 TaxID=3443742 RepID=UPI003F487DD0